MNTTQTQQHIHELSQLRQEMRRWRIAAAVASFVIITAGLITLKISATNLVQPGPKHDAFVAELRQTATHDVAPYLKERTVATFQELAPIVQAELVQLQTRYPEIADAVIDELEELNRGLPLRAEAIIEETLGQMVRNRTNQLLAQYPEMSKDDVALLVNAMLDESHARVTKVSHQILHPYLTSMDNIVASLEEIRHAEVDQFPPETTALDLAMTLVEILRAEINEAAPNDPSWTLLSTVLAQAK